MSIFITPNYVLSAGANANHPHIGYQTWVRDRSALDVVASSETGEGQKDAILRPETHEFWQANVLPADIIIDLGQARPVDYIGIAGHTIGSAGASVKAEHSPDGSVWADFASEVAPVDDAPIMFFDESISRRYWRITFPGSGDVPKMAVLHIGQVLASPTSIYGGHSPATLSRNTKLFQNMSDGGQFLGQYTRRRGIIGNLNLKNLEAPWYRTNFDPFVRVAREFPFFVAWRPIDWPLEVAYAWTDSNIKPTNIGRRDLMQVQFPFKGVGYID